MAKVRLCHVGFSQKDGVGIVHIDGKRAFYRAYSRGVKGFLEKENRKQYISTNGKISFFIDIFPFVFDILPLRDRHYRQEKAKTVFRWFTFCR